MKSTNISDALDAFRDFLMKSKLEEIETAVHRKLRLSFNYMSSQLPHYLKIEDEIYQFVQLFPLPISSETIGTGATAIFKCGYMSGSGNWKFSAQALTEFDSRFELRNLLTKKKVVI